MRNRNAWRGCVAYLLCKLQLGQWLGPPAVSTLTSFLFFQASRKLEKIKPVIPKHMRGKEERKSPLKAPGWVPLLENSVLVFPTALDTGPLRAWGRQIMSRATLSAHWNAGRLSRKCSCKIIGKRHLFWEKNSGFDVTFQESYLSCRGRQMCTHAEDFSGKYTSEPRINTLYFFSPELGWSQATWLKESFSGESHCPVPPEVGLQCCPENEKGLCTIFRKFQASRLGKCLQFFMHSITILCVSQTQAF